MISKNLSNSSPLALFDLDGTIIHGDSISLFLKCLLDHKLIGQEFCRTDDSLLQEFYEGKLDIIKYYRFSLTPLKQKTKQDLANILSEYLTDYVAPRIYPSAIKTIRSLREQGYKIIIVSATTDLIVSEIGYKLLGADHIIATRMMYDAQNRITGDIYPDISHQEGKARRIIELCQKEGYSLDNSIAFGDSINDIPMLELATEKRVVNPAGRMPEEAQNRAWTVLNWKEDKE